MTICAGEEMAKLLVCLTERLQELERLRAKECEEASSWIAELSLKIGEMVRTIADMATVQRQIADLTALVKSKDELIQGSRARVPSARRNVSAASLQKG